MNYVLILIPSITLVLGGIGGYFMGRYQTALIEHIRELEESTPYEPSPTVTMGVLSPPKAVSETDAPVGIAEAKTPQRVEYEAEQETERQGLS
jgi:hypothetical protein